jgi:hypothetical protein
MPSYLPRLLRETRGIEEGDRAVQAVVAWDRPGAGGVPYRVRYGATGASHGDFTRPAEYTFAART